MGIAEEITRDRLLGGRIEVLQPRTGFRIAIDTPLLAAAIEAPQGGRLLELGCGIGGAALCLLARRADLHVVGLELQVELAALARRNAELNALAQSFEVREGDAARLPPDLREGGFDHVFFNPPFHAPGNTHSPSSSKSKSSHETAALQAWIESALAALGRGCGLTLIHRSDRLTDVLALLQGRAGDIRVFPLWPRAGAPAKRVIVSARKGSRAATKLLAGLLLHEADGTFTSAADAVLRSARGLDLGL